MFIYIYIMIGAGLHISLFSVSLLTFNAAPCLLTLRGSSNPPERKLTHTQMDYIINHALNDQLTQ